MEIQENVHTGTNARKTTNSKSGKGILKTSTGDETIPNLEENTMELEKYEVPKTPFHIIGNQEQGYWGTMGAYRITGLYEQLNEVEEYINEINNWELIGNFVTALMDANNKIQNKKGGN